MSHTVSISESFEIFLEFEISSIKYSFMRWNCKGSSVNRHTNNPWLRKSATGFSEVLKKSQSFEIGVIIIRICAC